MNTVSRHDGVKEGEFLTPADVSELLTRLGAVGKTEIGKIYEIKARSLIQFSDSLAA